MAKVDKVVVSGVPSSLVDEYVQIEREIKALTERKAQVRKVLLAYVPTGLEQQPVSLLLPGATWQILLSKPTEELMFIDDPIHVKQYIQNKLSPEAFVRLARFTIGDLRTAMTPQQLEDITVVSPDKVRKFITQAKG